MNSISAAELKYYNANNRGKSVGDCVKRAISLAFDTSYSEVGKLLNSKMKELRKTKWNIVPVFSKVIEELGGGQNIKEEENITLDEFVDTKADPNYIYVLLVGKRKGENSHMVAVRNNKIWDSWNSKDNIVNSYWKIDGSNSKPIRDTDKNWMSDMAHNYAEPAVTNELLRYMNKKDWTYKSYEVNAYAKTSYKIKVYCSITLEADLYVSKDRIYDFEVTLVIEPTWDEEEVIEFIQKFGKQKTYDRLWAIGEQEKKVKEEYAMIQELGGDQSNMEDMYLNTAERRFVSTLPGWVRPLIQYLWIQSPGEYSDSYSLRIGRLPGDTLHKGTIRFEDYDADGIRYQLDRYKKTYEVGGVDYDKDW